MTSGETKNRKSQNIVTARETKISGGSFQLINKTLTGYRIKEFPL